MKKLLTAVLSFAIAVLLLLNFFPTIVGNFLTLESINDPYLQIGGTIIGFSFIIALVDLLTGGSVRERLFNWE